MKPLEKPQVKTRESGVHYVEAADVIRSESGKRQIEAAAKHAAAARRNARSRQARNRAA